MLSPDYGLRKCQDNCKKLFFEISYDEKNLISFLRNFSALFFTSLLDFENLLADSHSLPRHKSKTRFAENRLWKAAVLREIRPSLYWAKSGKLKIRFGCVMYPIEHICLECSCPNYSSNLNRATYETKEKTIKCLTLFTFKNLKSKEKSISVSTKKT